MARRGFLVAFEGLDGCGKDTQIQEFCKMLDKNSIKYAVVNQLETEVGRVIRSKYLSGEVKVDEKVVDILFAADRLEYLTSTVKSLLNEEKVVILNRYLLSALAYGCYKSSLLSYDGTVFDYDKDYYRHIMALNDTAFQTYWPDLTIYLRITPAESLRRIDGRGEKPEIYEDPRKQIYIQRMFMECIDKFNNKGIKMIDAQRSVEEIRDDVWNVFSNFCPRLKVIKKNN